MKMQLSQRELDARNLSLGELMGMLEEIEGNDSVIAREAISRLWAAANLAVKLENSMFYVRMYQDTTPEGKIRREELIDDAEAIISVLRNGGLYP